MNLTMPQLGESVLEGTITKWLVREGDSVKREQPLVSVATDKADTEVPAPEPGRIVRLLAAEGETVKVGAPLCEIDTSAAAAAGPASQSVPSPAEPTIAESPRIAMPPADVRSAATVRPGGDASTARSLSSPAVRKIALEHGVDLSRVDGSGEHGRVTRDDVLRAAQAPSAPAAPAYTPAPAREAASAGSGDYPVPNVGYRAYKVPPYRPQPGDQVVPFTRRRRLTADHMVYSKVTAPHVVTVAEVDLARVMKLREANKDRYKKEGVPLTVLSFVCAAAVRALREYPNMNARVLDDAFVLLKSVNLGVAVDAPDGLVVPNIKRADDLSLRGLAKAIDDVARRARDGKITADDLAGGSFSISNPGLKGNLFGGAIISQPNVGILRMGEIQKRVVVVESPEGEDQMAIHPVMFMALSYDHRIVDGVLANSFLWRVTEILETGDFTV